ncbi:hypothetical protein [Streptomyces sp. NPDC014622]|uniref:hypothetical protein n=1 Tax=Streptomyces sp. NPDC014622 TaxID=3364874 RepID=UPI0036F75177
MDTYYSWKDRTPAAVAVDACRGRQVLYEATQLVGCLPSELTPWIESAAAESLEDMPRGSNGLRIGLNRQADLPGLGLITRCQQNGDYSRTRRVLVAREWAEGSVDSCEGPIPQREWSCFWSSPTDVG